MELVKRWLTATAGIWAREVRRRRRWRLGAHAECVAGRWRLWRSTQL